LKALEVDPRHTGAYTNLGNVLKRQGRVDEAMAAYRAAIAYDPTHPEASKLLGLALLASARIEEAREVYRQWLDRDPGNAVAIHMLAACGGERTPARAADGYVRGMFDQMADHFDEHLLSLNYRAPELVAQVVTRRTGQVRGILRVLDAGCGTGLCGRFLRGYAVDLVGVDLSPRMLARAAEQRLYDRLVESELVAYLQGRQEVFDLLVCTDTLCYFGDLRALIAAVVGALIPGGLFVFTVERAHERSDGRGYALARHGRYVHTERYVREALEGAGFDAIEIEEAHLRDEARMPVAGLVCSART
jgi:predicted TPR repeat methyltransferase